MAPPPPVTPSDYLLAHFARCSPRGAPGRADRCGRARRGRLRSAVAAVPARDESAAPSARTSTFKLLERPITFKVNLLSGGVDDLTSRSSLLRRTFPTPRAPNPPSATDESRLAPRARRALSERHRKTSPVKGDAEPARWLSGYWLSRSSLTWVSSHGPLSRNERQPENV